MINEAVPKYADAVTAAKKEFDELIPQANRINERINNLRMLIRAGSNLLGLDVDEEYEWPTVVRVRQQQTKTSPDSSGVRKYHGTKS